MPDKVTTAVQRAEVVQLSVEEQGEVSGRLMAHAWHFADASNGFIRGMGVEQAREFCMELASELDARGAYVDPAIRRATRRSATRIGPADTAAKTAKKGE